MSKVTISGNASGTGVFTIAAPNSNTDRVLTLPDEAGTVLTSASSVATSQLPSQLSVNASASSGSLAIDSSGRVTMPYQPSFSAKGYQTRQSGAFDSWSTVYHNNGSHFNSSTGAFTAPVTGYYQCNATMSTNGVTTGQWIGIQFAVNGSGIGNQAFQTASTTNDTSVALSQVIYLSSGDAVTLLASNQGTWGNFYGFSIQMVG